MWCCPTSTGVWGRCGGQRVDVVRCGEGQLHFLTGGGGRGVWCTGQHLYGRFRQDCWREGQSVFSRWRAIDADGVVVSVMFTSAVVGSCNTLAFITSTFLCAAFFWVRVPRKLVTISCSLSKTGLFRGLVASVDACLLCFQF